MGSMSPPRRILLITNSEHGQANVYLAVTYALLTLEDEDVEVHVASFSPVEKSVRLISQYALEKKPTARPIFFHRIEGLNMVEAWSRPEIIAERDFLDGGTGFMCAIRRMWLLLRVTLPWSGPEFVQIFRSVVDIVQKVQPDLSAVDPAFSPGLTALRHIQSNFVILSPNTIKDFAMPLQPNGEALWKYPCVGKPYDYPVPLLCIPDNIFLILLVVICGLLDPNRRKVKEYVREHGEGAKLTTLNDLSFNPKLGIKFLVANKKQLEFPHMFVPKHIIPCGPMIRPAKPLGEVDPELAVWLDKGPTLYINLGTHAKFSETFAIEMAGSIRMLLDQSRAGLWRDKTLSNLQVLWKLTTDGTYDVATPGSKIHNILGRDLDKGIVRVVEWIEAEPIAVLERGTVVCAIHHGGANSFLEVVSAGVPMVVLPAWMDCFDFARRAEVLGIGRWGNRTAAGQCRSAELGLVLIDMLVSGRSSAYAGRAKELAAVCQEHGGGRMFAARYLLAKIGDSETDSEASGERTVLVNGAHS